MRTGLDASTVTPGRTAPDVSLTVPVMDACANTDAGSRKTTQASTCATRRARGFNRASLTREPRVDGLYYEQSRDGVQMDAVARGFYGIGEDLSMDMSRGGAGERRAWSPPRHDSQQRLGLGL